MSANEYLKDFDEESQKILLAYQNSIISEKVLQQALSEKAALKTNTDVLSSKTEENINWETDEYINLKLLTAKIKFAQSGSRDYQFEYDIQNLESNMAQKSVNDTKNSYIRLKVYRNPRVGNVSVKWNNVRVIHEIDTRKKVVYYKLHFHYTDLSEIAFILETTDYQEFRNLNILLGYGDIDDYDIDYKYFLKNFAEALQKESEPSYLKFLYENIPESLLVNISSLVDSNLIFEHLCQLTEYDDTGVFSGWKDGSSAIVNVLRCIDPIFLLNEFKKKPNLCNRIYYNLDMASEMEGEMMPNRIIFATILMQYCIFSHNRPKEGAPTFTIGDNYKVATNVTELGGDFLTFGKSDKDTFFLQQQQKYIVEQENYETDDLGVSTIAKNNITETLTRNLDDGGQYSPLEMVFFIDKNINSEIDIPSPVPAIYVKALADLEKWERINKTIRIVADIVGTTLGIGTLLLTGNPYIALAAAADLALSGMDLTVPALRGEIAKLEGGEQFLKEWDIFYNNGGAIIAAPQLIAGIYKSIFKLLLLPKAAANVKQGLKAMAISVFLDLNSGVFQRKDLRLFSPTEWIVPSAGFFSKTKECEMLVENGAFFIELDAATINGKVAQGINPDKIGTITNKRKFALVYEGEIIAQGNRYDKEYQRLLMDLKKTIYNEKKLKEFLDNFINRRRTVSLADNSLLGSTPTKGVKMSFTLLDELGNNIGQLTRSPNKNELYYKLIYRNKEIDIKSFMQLLDDKYRLKNLPIEKGEHLLYGDLNIPKEITDKYSGLGQIIYEDGLKYFLNAKKYGKVDGTVNIWIKSDIYSDYGGQSINLEQFWKAVDNGMSHEDAAFETFSGKQAKKFGFTNVRSNIKGNIVTRDEIVINFLK